MKKIHVYAALALLSLNLLVFLCGVAFKLSSADYYNKAKAGMVLKSALVYAARNYEDFGRKVNDGGQVDIKGIKAAYLISKETDDFISITISTRVSGKSYTKKYISRK